MATKELKKEKKEKGGNMQKKRRGLKSGGSTTNPTQVVQTQHVVLKCNGGRRRIVKPTR
jgi:type III secretory pathway component EscU